MLKQVQHDVMAQGGRSMVEMLGVLVIIAVLGVAGMAGYTIAKNKHRANTLLDGASKRATVVAMQLAAGKAASIAEFGDNDELGFTAAPQHDDTNKTFTLTLGSVAEGVCQQMKATVGTNGIMQISGTCGQDLALIFKDDLSPSVASGGGESNPCPGNGELGNDNSTCCYNRLAWSNPDNYYADINISACGGCPDDGYKGKNGSCCKDGNAWDGWGYHNSHTDCYREDCLEGGTWGSDDQTCCRDGYPWNGSDYDTESLNPVVCGCPDGGTPNGENCCLDGEIWLMGEYTPDYSVCGCPEGGSFGTDGSTCCKGGYALDEISGDYDYFDADKCDCPSGGSPNSIESACCRETMKWNNVTEDYDIPDPYTCGCPANGSPGGDAMTCCKDGFAWNENSRTYTLFEPSGCGCPDEGVLTGGVCCKNNSAWSDSSNSYSLSDPECSGWN